MTTVFVSTLICLTFFALLAISHWLTQKWLVYALAPITLTLVLSLAFTVKSIMSMPVPGMPDKFSLISHFSDGETIFMWVAVENRSEPATHFVPYTEETQKKLEQLQAQTQAGLPVVGIKSDLDVSGLELTQGVLSSAQGVPDEK